MTQDVISDMLTRIRNGVIAKHNFVTLKFSKQSCEILKIFTKEGYIAGFTIIEHPYHKIKVFLKYKGSWIKTPLISEIKRVSKPGQRVYSSYKNFLNYGKYLKYNQGIAIVSTSSGIISHVKASYYKKGGEIICYLK